MELEEGKCSTFSILAQQDVLLKVSHLLHGSSEDSRLKAMRL